MYTRGNGKQRENKKTMHSATTVAPNLYWDSEQSTKDISANNERKI